MKTLKLRDAKASLSAVVEAAQRGEPTTITKRGKAAAVVIPADEAERLYPKKRPSFSELLMSIPDDLEIERDPTPLRDVEL